jgi:hypothetical protein
MAVDVVVPGHADDPILFTSDELRHPVEEVRSLVVVSFSSSGADIANHEYCVARSGSRHDVTEVDEKAPPDFGVEIETAVSISKVMEMDI